jgi:hypothetical protein
MRYINQELIKAKSKKGLLPAETLQQAENKEPIESETNNDDVLSLLQDTTVSGIILGNVARISRSRFVYNGNKNKAKKLKQILERDFKLPLKMPQIYANAFLYHNLFLEKNLKGSEIKDLDVLETREMSIKSDTHGKPFGYVQTSKDGEIPFLAEEVIHIPILPITGNNWGYAFNKNLINIVNAKLQLLNYLHWLISTNQFRNIHSIEEGEETAVQEYLSYLKQAENVPTKPLAVDGKVIVAQLRTFADGANFINLIEYYNSEIFRIMQTPPIGAGVLENSNRSSTEGQENFMDMWFDFIDKRILDHFNIYLLPDLGFEDIELTLSPRDKSITKPEIEVIRGLKELGLNTKGLEVALRNAGMIFEEGVKIEEPKPEEQSGSKFMGEFPSRQPKDNFSERKTGEESSTRPEQLGMKSNKPDFNKYPYVMS